jgi:type II secretory pathway pseudopilin PulG|tara:strand:+ start:5682 stop:6479 length:798 start_codon:yes stop_codon:yes gene_type:complete
MIKFFRKIRQKKLSENLPTGQAGKFSKYLLYAIGEIVLVVIGILIALSINNWNQNQKTRNQETQIYLELKNDLIQTRNDIRETVTKHKKIFKSNQQLITDICDKKPYSESIYEHFTSASADFQIVPKTSAFENLKNIGLNTLSNDSLRISITNMFQLDLKRFDDELQMNSSGFTIPKFFVPFQMKYLIADRSQPKNYGFKYSDSISIYRLKINAYDEFLNDNELLKSLQLVLFNRGKKIDHEMETINAIDKLIKKIDEELKSRNQ